MTGGVVTAINVSGGSGYTVPPVVTIAPPQSQATAVATVSGGKPNAVTLTSGVTAIGLTNTGGTGYTSSFPVTISAPPAGQTPAGVQATATALVDASGAISSIVITNPGSGYTTAPTISFGNGTGTGAAAVASLTLGGSGYLSATPNTTLVTFSGGGTGATGATTSATLVNGVITAITPSGGTSYSAAPTVAIPSPTVQATAKATVTSGVVSITAANIVGGAGYTSPPVVTIGPPPSGGRKRR